METNYKGYTIKLELDEDSMNPRTEWDNVGTIVAFHRRYTLGDLNTGYSKDDASSWDELRALITKREQVAVILPLYLYDHSGITISTSPFNCRWDSGQVGFIFISKEKVKKEYSAEWFKKYHKGKKKVEVLTSILEGEVETFDKYLRGEVLSYIIEKDGMFMDSCGGYFETEEYVIGEAKDVINSYIRHDMKKHIDKLKIWIKNRVPYTYREALKLI